MRDRMRRLLIAAAGILLAAAPGLAQGNPTGRISGRVTAEGAGLPGVLVSASSTHLQGTRETFTSANGDYLLSALPPGTYSLSFALEGFAPQTAQVVVSATQGKSFDAVLEVSGVEEEIVVTGNAETISEGATGSTTYDYAEVVGKLATNRDLEAAIELAPGVNFTGPTRSDGTGAVTISGGQSFENLFMVNGVVVNENLRGQALDLFIEDAIQETTAAVSGISAEYGRFTGGVVNTITKSGGNAVHGSLRTSFENESWESETPVTVDQDDSTRDTWEGTLGGRIVKDRLWYFLAGRTFERDLAEQTFVYDVPYSEGRSQDRLEAKLTATLTPGHALLFSYIDIEDVETNNNPFDLALEPAGLSDREDPQTLQAANYTGVLTDKFLVEAQYSEREWTVAKGAGATGFSRHDGITMIDIQNSGATYHIPYFCGVCSEDQRNNENWLAKASYFASVGKGGSHDLVLGYDSFNDIVAEENHQSPTGFQIWSDTTIFRDGEVFPVITPFNAEIWWFPIFNPGRGTDFKTDSAFLNDRWVLNDHWSFNLGVRYDQNDFVNSARETVADDDKLSPRLAINYDLKGDGDWIFNASYGHYVGSINNSVGNDTSTAGTPGTLIWLYGGDIVINEDPDAPNLLTSEQAIDIVFDWFDSIGGTDDREFQVAADIPGSSTIIRDSLVSPNAQELTVGMTKRLGSKGLLRADYVRREYDDFYFQQTDLSTGQGSTPELGEFDLTLLRNDNEVFERVYDGLHTQFSYRVNDRLDVAGNWSWSHARGNYDGENSDQAVLPGEVGQYPEYKAFAQHFPRGDLGVDARHKVRAWAIYDLLRREHHNLTVSWLERFQSGTPYGALGDVRSRLFIANPGYLTPPSDVDYWFTDRDAFTTDDIHSTNLTLIYAFTWKAFGKELEIFLQPQLLNAFDESGEVSVNQTVLEATNASAYENFDPYTETPVEGTHFDFGEDFGRARREEDFQQPRTYRFSVGFRF
jgi:Carboxypeptidase regulatory-like domain/TonB dependent receptor